LELHTWVQFIIYFKFTFTDDKTKTTNEKGYC
jgi:hypothetical protein